MNVLPPYDMVDWMLSNGKLLAVLVALAGVAIVLFGVARFVRSATTGGANRTRRPSIAKSLTERWQLALLGTTGVVLSIASGYTTWIGMTHFTGEAALSMMVTFGIQGVMLIVAWLIGESFAVGMNRRLPDGTRVRSSLDAVIGMLLALAVVAATFYWVLYSSRTIGWSRTGFAEPVNWTRFADISVYFALGLIVLAVLAFNFSRRGELSLPYVQSARIIIRNSVLWVMFLACMATSVFFSFDALFTSIFPKEERARAAQLRAQNQVAGVIADIGSTIETRRIAEIDHLFANKGWLAYDDHLTKLAAAATGAQNEIEAYFNSQIEAKKRAITTQQERIATARSGSAGLQTKKTVLMEELARLTGERPGLASDLTEKKTELDNRARGVDAKRVEAQAESKGAEGTLKEGRGPVWRQRMAELSQLQAAYKIQEDRVRDAQKRLSAVDVRISQLKREVATLDGDLAGLKAEAQTAEARIKLAEGQSAGEGLPRVDPSRVLPAFEKARVDFRQEPTRERLAALQQQCSNLFGALASTPATKARVRDIECDPKQAAEASAVMFALNDGIKVFGANCAGGDKLAQQTTTDGLWTFARKCLVDSGLPSKETDELRGRINHAELSRDDKAHPFVATINAFQDGNRLAYLALFIAIAIDSLVFMSGLFGANAVRSPLSDVPSNKARSGRQLEAIIENALLPDSLGTARYVLNTMRPMTAHDGFTHRVLVHDGDPHAADVRRVLNAAATIGAVRHVDSHDERYEVRSELFEFLSLVAKRAFERSAEHAREAELKTVVSVALQPHVGDHADLVLHHCRPISERDGYSSEIYLSQMTADDAFVVQKALNAGSTLNYVLLDDRKDQLPLQRFYVHKQLYKTLLLISAAYPKTGGRSYAPRLGAAQDQLRLPGTARDGGDITPTSSRIAAEGPRPALPAASGNMTNAFSPPATPVETPRPAAAADSGQGPSILQLQQNFTMRLIEGLGVNPEDYLLFDGTWSAALAASDTFKAVRSTSPALNRLVDEEERKAQATIDVAHERLLQTPEAGTGTGRHALDQAYQDVLHNLALITLLPGGPVERLLKSLIARLEPDGGAGQLPPEQEDLLRFAKRLWTRIEDNPRLTADDWDSLENAFVRDHLEAEGKLTHLPQHAAKRSQS